MKRSWILSPIAAALALASAPLAALIGGQPDTERHYGSVVALRIGPARRCTATKIGPRGFLTAAHCTIDIPAGTLAPELRPEGRIALSDRIEPDSASDYRGIRVAETRIAPAFALALDRLHAYQESRIAELRARWSGDELALRIRQVYRDSNIAERFPDLAMILVEDETPWIPVATVDLRPLVRDTEVVLVGYGCERVAELAARAPKGPGGHGFVRRSWGRSRVIRVDAVNYYTFAGELRPGSPTLCPGDSGGPVLKDGRVVGVHGTVYGLGVRDSARSNMSVNLAALAGWDAWSQAARVLR